MILQRPTRYRWFGLGLAAVCVAIYFNNASWLAPEPHGTPRLLAHRGVHLDFDRKGLTASSCAASRIIPPFVNTLENTLDSMRAAFEHGAELVELDIRSTTDREFAVFHDYTLDCATNGAGLTSDHDLAYLKRLDIGYGYTPDGGRTFPYRAKGVGLMPSLTEVVATFPDRKFLIHLKNGSDKEGALFAEHVQRHPGLREMTWAVYGGRQAVERAQMLVPGLRGYTYESIRSCGLPYMLFGWSGLVPGSCTDAILLIPADYAVWLWGWPNRFIARMGAARAELILRAPSGRERPEGIDTELQLADVPHGFPGWIWTNRIQELGPALRRRLQD